MADKEEVNKLTIYVFDCPKHGRELIAFCFRAGDPDNRKRWKKFVGRIVPMDESEIKERLKIMKEHSGRFSIWAGSG